MLLQGTGREGRWGSWRCPSGVSSPLKSEALTVAPPLWLQE